MSEPIAKRQRVNALDIAVVNEEIEEATSRVEFADLNDDCLRLVFAELPIQELVKFRAVCIKWNDIISIDICGLKQSLKLFFEVGDSKFKKHPCYSCANRKDSNYFDVLSSKEYATVNSDSDELKIYMKHNNKFPRADLSHVLGGLFPKVRKLFISKDVFSVQDDRFVRIWTELTSLTLIVHDISTGFESDFCETLNSLENLRKLNLLVCFMKSNIKNGNLSQLAPTLFRLESFAIKDHSKRSDILALLGSNCRELRMECVPFLNNHDRLYSAFMRKPTTEFAILQNLTHLVLTNCLKRSLDKKDILALIFENVTNLQYFAIQNRLSNPGLEILSSFLTADLVKAHNLQELKLLGIYLNIDYNFHIAPINVNSVKCLTLSPAKGIAWTLNTINNSDGWAESLSSIFPNLEQLKLNKLSRLHLGLKQEVENKRHLFKSLKVLSCEVV